MINRAVREAFRRKKERGWDCIYWAVDIHDTIFPGKYCSDQEYIVSSKYAPKVLKWISDQPDHKIIVWTSSYAKDFEKVARFFKKEYGINFDYHNGNPECGNNKYAEFTSKFYFNILCDDKAGFCQYTDWLNIWIELERMGYV